MAWSGYLLDDLLCRYGLEFGRAEIAERAVQAGAVEPADVLDDRPARHGAGGPGLQVEQLSLDRGEERFGEGVVPALAGAAEGQRHLAVAGQASERGRRVLAAPVRVEDHSGGRVAGGDGVGQRISN